MSEQDTSAKWRVGDMCRASQLSKYSQDVIFEVVLIGEQLHGHTRHYARLRALYQSYANSSSTAECNEWLDNLVKLTLTDIMVEYAKLGNFIAEETKRLSE